MKRIFLSIVIFVLILALCPAASALVEKRSTENQALQTVEVGIPVEERPELFITRSMPTHGEAKIAVFLIEFPDFKNDNPIATKEYYDKIYFNGGVETIWGNEASVASFYRDESYGKLNISGQVFDWYTAAHERSYYNNKKPELIIEAAEHYMAQGIDFSDFDGDGDGVIDAVAFHFAGTRSNVRGDSWYDGVNIDEGGTIGDVAFNRIVQVGETSGSDSLDLIEVVCHELMHSLGMPDLYSQIGHVGSLLAHDLMSKNKQTINPYTKMLLGWLDTVDVVTGDVSNIKLSPYGTDVDGKAIIVTNEFNGLFDEFFIVAYREYRILKNTYYTAVIWHVDARLNEGGTGFLFNNLNYYARPDKEPEHGASVYSPYPFIEELSADYKWNRVQQYPDVRESAFLEDSVLGPDTLPSSDTHDGHYTGIRIDNFVQHDLQFTTKEGNGKPYLTFDVAFVKDLTPPTVITKSEDMRFHKSVSIEFHESIYKGDNWDSIKVTDLEGNPLDASVILPHYPNNEIEITFNTEAYKEGYTVTLPKGCVCDSSGNEFEEITLTVASSKFFPVSSTQLPSAGYTRGQIYFFPDENGISVVSCLWDYSPTLETNEMDRKIEIMRLDSNGNLLSQVVVDNPLPNTEIPKVMKMSSGDFLFLCKHSMSSGTYLLAATMFFCLDANGEVKWINVSADEMGLAIYDSESENGYFEVDGDLVILMKIINSGEMPRFMRFDLESGEITPFETPYDEDIRFCSFHDLGNGRVMCYGSDNKSIDGVAHKSVQIFDAVTFEVLCEGYIPDTVSFGNVLEAHANKDGTFMLYCRGVDNMSVIRLDGKMNVVGSVVLARSKQYEEQSTFNRLSDDGFYIQEMVARGNFHTSRYDQYLNLMWETDLSSNGTYFFKSSNGDIKAFSSMMKPVRECYIELYGSEKKYLTLHSHTLIHNEAREPSGGIDGYFEHWYCTGCGVSYSDEGNTVINDVGSLVIHKGDQGDQGECKHSYELVVEKKPSCCTSGVGHRVCSVCGDRKGNEEIPASEEYHIWGKWEITQQPTVDSEGIESRICKECKKAVETRSIDKLTAEETEEKKETTAIDQPDQGEKEPADTTHISVPGCGGTVAIDAIVLVVLISTCGLIFKKKQDCQDI